MGFLLTEGGYLLLEDGGRIILGDERTARPDPVELLRYLAYLDQKLGRKDSPGVAWARAHGLIPRRRDVRGIGITDLPGTQSSAVGRNRGPHVLRQHDGDLPRALAHGGAAIYPGRAHRLLSDMETFLALEEHELYADAEEQLRTSYPDALTNPEEYRWR